MKVFLFVGIGLVLLLRNASAVEDAPKAEVTLAIYDVRGITSNVTDFPGVTLSLADEDDESPVITGHVEPIGAIGQLSAADISMLIQERILPAEFVDPQTSIQESGGKLVVMQRGEVHKKIATVLKKLRERMRPKLAVAGCCVRVAKLPGKTYLSNQAFQAWTETLDTKAILARPSILCNNFQRLHTLGVRSFSYVADLEISGDSHDPVMRTVHEGILFDVRPNLSSDRTYIGLELIFDLNARIKMGSRLFKVDRKQVETQKAIDKKLGVASVPPIEFRLDTPSVDVHAVQTEVTIPKGKWVMAAVMSNTDPKTKAATPHIVLYVTARVVGED